MKTSKLRFEDEAPANDTAATSGQICPKSKRKRSRLREDTDQPRPSERLRQEERSAPGPDSSEAPPKAGAEDLAGKGAPPSGDSPHGGTSGADTSGQFGPKSKKRLRQEQQTEKSKLKMERTDEKLTAAKEKLAAQKPPKKPGAVKKLGKAAGYSVHGYIHGKIYQVEHENVGTEAAHKTELVGEAVGGAAIRYAKRHYRNRHSIRVQKLQKQQVNASADYGSRAAAMEHPELQSNPISRYLQKQQLKKQYRKEAKAAAKGGAGAVKRTAEATGRAAASAWHFVKSNPKVVLMIIALLLLVMLISGLLSMCSTVGTGIISAVGGTSYTSQDADLIGAEQDYVSLETELNSQIANIERDYPGYDEYRYQLDEIVHNPHELAALLVSRLCRPPNRVRNIILPFALFGAVKANMKWRFL